MIHDHIDQADAYLPLLPGLDKAIAFLREQPLAELGTGKHVIDGDRLFVIIDRYTPRTDEQQVWEAHERYADVQLIVAGRERMGVLPLNRATAIKTPYDAEKDAAFYEPASPAADPLWLTMTPGHFAVFLPQDIHAPGLRLNANSVTPVVKAVVKVAVG